MPQLPPPAIWRSWSLAERRRFLRHAQPWWDIHRHRMAPAVAAELKTLLARGRLEVVAARLEAVEPGHAGLSVALRRRGEQQADRRRFGAVVNCTGLSGDLAGSPILRSLVAGGSMRPDALRLGADVDDQLRVLATGGVPVAGLYAVGPLTRGGRWETVAVPDLRNQTAEVAGHVLDHLPSATG